MDPAVTSKLRTQTVLQQMLEEINFQRTKEMRQMMKDGKLNIKDLSAIHLSSYSNMNSMRDNRYSHVSSFRLLYI